MEIEILKWYRSCDCTGVQSLKAIGNYPSCNPPLYKSEVLKVAVSQCLPHFEEPIKSYYAENWQQEP